MKIKFALRYLNAGHCPIPIWPDKRKNPKIKNLSQYHARRPSAGDWSRWGMRWPDCNIGLITGYYGFCALDFDSVDDYAAWGMELETWTVKTARGYHVWFYSQDAGNSRSFTKNGHEVLLRAKGGYCIAPPSIHHTGAKYKTVKNLLPITITVDKILPGWQEKITKSKGGQPDGRALPPEVATKIEDLIIIPDNAKPNRWGAYQVFCPFHQDENPSAWVNPVQGRFGCNACWPGLWWDVVNVYAMLNKVSNTEAYKRLRR